MSQRPASPAHSGVKCSKPGIDQHQRGEEKGITGSRPIPGGAALEFASLANTW